MPVRLPPLRERGEDIVRLAEHFLAQACEDYGFPGRSLAPDAREALRAYSWPGNVRELANAMERVALLSDVRTVTAETLGLPDVGLGPALNRGSDGGERARLLEALEATDWNLSPETGHAETQYRDAAEVARERGMRPLLAHCHRGLGMLHRRAADGARATEHLTAATEMYREMGMHSWLE